MITAEIEFHAPRQLSDALALLARYGDAAKLLGGGMSLVPTMNLGLARPEVLISLNHVAELAGIRETDDELRIGGGTTHAQIAGDPLVARHCPILAEAARNIGDVQVRNRGTIGGSTAHADPAADYLPVLVALGATIVAASTSGERAVPAAEFFVDIMLTSLNPDELIAEVRVPKLPTTTGTAYRRLARVEGSFPIVNAAAVVAARGPVRVAIGGVAARPVLVDLTNVLGNGVDEAALERAADAVREACADAFEDLNGDAEYRREMAAVYARRAIVAAGDAPR